MVMLPFCSDAVMFEALESNQLFYDYFGWVEVKDEK
jgi:hypothetical protein